MTLSWEKVTSAVHPDDQPLLTRTVEEIISRGGGSGSLEYRFLRRDGQELWVKDLFRIFVDDSGRPLFCIGSIQDNTELKTLELIAKKAQERLVHLNTVTFQDIMNTNYALTGYIDLIRDANTDPALSHYLDAVDTLIRKNDSILKNAKEYQEMGSLPPRWHEVSLTILTAISHMDLSHLSRVMELDGLHCYADPLLEHAFCRIFENVILHSRHATRLSLTCRENPDSLSLFIEDNGVGVPAEDKECIFEKSYPRHSGMGLYLVREILSITGMTIRENGEPGKGARFEIIIPANGYRFA